MSRTPLLRTILACLLVLAALVPARPALAVQPVEEAGEGDGSSPAAQGGKASAGTGEIDIRVGTFGIGNRPRPGDWVAVRLELMSRTDKRKNVLVTWTLPDAEGDIARPQRAIVPEPGVRRSVWLYGRLPFTARQGTLFEFNAYEAEEETGADGRIQYVPGRQVGSARVPMPANVMTDAALIGVVGTRVVGLDQYTIRLPTMNFTPTGHEPIEVVSGLRIGDIPDRWLGLAPLEALVWTATGPEGEPRDLTESQAEAIRDWVQLGGGHLVIVLPAVGQGWLGRSDHPLASIMPVARVQTREGVSLEPYRRLLTSKRDVQVPQQTVVNVLEPDPGATPHEAIRVLTGADGSAVAVRRLVGAGAVTVIGLDLRSSMLARMGGIESDILWNRVLGKRIDLLSPEELSEAQRSGALFAYRTDRWLDRDIAGAIAMSGQAAGGLLLAFFVFLLYWLAAGPGGYFVLRRRGLKHHSWVMFVLVAGVFTAVAWGGANMLKERRVIGRHLTLLDHVYGQPNQRARMWMNLLLPRYGEQRVMVGEPRPAGERGEGGSGAYKPAISSWDTPPSTVGLGKGTGSFPDARAYPVDARQPDMVEVPARSTVRQFQADWAGPPRWDMPTPMLPAGSGPVAIGSELRLTREAGRAWTLDGTLVHQLPGALRDVVIIVVPRQAALTASPGNALTGEAFATSLLDSWDPNEPLDLRKATDPPPGRGRPLSREFFGETLLGRAAEFGAGQEEATSSSPGRDIDRRLTALSLYSMLEGPNPRETQRGSVLARRQAAHGWDLGRWFTQPCVIIIGHLEEAPSPVPITVDGVPAVLTGRTVVRWIYPLPEDPPAQQPVQDSGGAI